MLGALAAGLGLAGDTSAAGGAEAVEEARRRVRALLESKTVHFNGAGDTKTVTGGLKQAWSVDYAGDRAKAASNREVLDAIAALMREQPQLGMRVHAETAHADTAPDRLAAKYGLHPRTDVQACMDPLAR